jgi:hypothetical protein
MSQWLAACEESFTDLPCFHTARAYAMAASEAVDWHEITPADLAMILSRLEPFLKGLFQ